MSYGVVCSNLRNLLELSLSVIEAFQHAPGSLMIRNAMINDPLRAGIKEYSDWPTIPQLYVDKEFVGGCDILISMHKDGSLADLLSQKKVLVTEDGDD